MVHKPLFPSEVEALRRRFVQIADADVAKLRRIPERDAATREAARCGYCGGKPVRHTDVIVDDMWQEQPIDGDWMTAARLVYQGDDLVIGELRVFPRDRVPDDDGDRGEAGVWSAELLGQRAPVPPGGLSARMLRQVRLRHAETRTSLLRMYGRERPELFAPSGRFHALGVKKPKGAQAKRSDFFYAMLALEYVQAMAEDSRRPVAAVAKRRGLETPRVRDLLRTARERGLLTLGRQGRSGGALTPRALDLLEGESDRRQAARGSARRTKATPKVKRRRSKHGKSG